MPAGSALDDDTVQAVFGALLESLRADTGRVVADLLSPTPLPPVARAAAFELQRHSRVDLPPPVDRNPFQSVVVDHRDEARWQALLVLAPYSPDLRLEAGFLTEVFSSSGGLGSVRLRLRPDELERVRHHLSGVPGLPAGVTVVPRRPWRRRRPSR